MGRNNLGFDSNKAQKVLDDLNLDNKEPPTRDQMSKVLCAGLGMSSCTPQDLADRGITTGRDPKKIRGSCDDLLDNGNCFDGKTKMTTDQMIVFMDRATKVCPSGWSGSWPSCVAPAAPVVTGGGSTTTIRSVCPTGWSGTYPRCTAPVSQPTVNVISEEGSTPEGATMTFEVSLTRPTSNTRPVAVSYAITSDTATESACNTGGDYTATAGSGTLRWGDGESDTQTISVPICTDEQHTESGESVTVTLSDPDNVDIHGAFSTVAIGSIPPQVSLTEARVEAQEGSEHLEFGLVLEFASDEDVVVNYQVAADTAGSGDFRHPANQDQPETSTGQVLIPAGSTEPQQPVYVSTIHDTTPERDETVTLTLTDASGASLGDRVTAVGVIKDDDPWPVSNLTLTCVEDGSQLRLIVGWDRLSSDSADSYEAAIHIGNPVSSISALRENIMVVWGTSVDLWMTNTAYPPRNRLEQTRWNNVYNFNSHHPVHSERYSVHVRSKLSGGADGPWSSDTVTCPAPPQVTANFGQASYTVAEGDNVTVTVTLSADPKRRVTIPVIATNQGGATSADYAGVPASVTFNSGETSKTVTFIATDDTDNDDGESVILGFGTLPTAVNAGTTDEATVTITDDDEKSQPEFLS